MKVLYCSWLCYFVTLNTSSPLSLFVVAQTVCVSNFNKANENVTKIVLMPLSYSCTFSNNFRCVCFLPQAKAYGKKPPSSLTCRKFPHFHSGWNGTTEPRRKHFKFIKDCNLLFSRFHFFAHFEIWICVAWSKQVDVILKLYFHRQQKE